MSLVLVCSVVVSLVVVAMVGVLRRRVREVDGSGLSEDWS